MKYNFHCKDYDGTLDWAKMVKSNRQGLLEVGEIVVSNQPRTGVH